MRRALARFLATAAMVMLAMSAAGSARATVPGENGRIVFINSGQIFSMTPTGTDLRQLTHFTGGHSAASPSVSPDGRQVVYLSDVSGSPQVWVMRMDGTRQHRVSHDPDYEPAYPSWLPIGPRILFARCSHVYGTCRVATMRADGTDIREVTHGYWHDGTGAQGDGTLRSSPDGKQIVFSSDRGGYDSRAWIVNTDGTDLHELSPASIGESGATDWAPDGRRILLTGIASWSGPAGVCCSVYAIQPNGSGLRLVRKNALGAVASPDGTKILLITTANASRLAIMNTDGTGFHQIGSLAPDFSNFTWATAP